MTLKTVGSDTSEADMFSPVHPGQPWIGVEHESSDPQRS